jgi:AraC-like DNA-binding protein
MEYFGSQIGFPLVNRSGFAIETGSRSNVWKSHPNFELLIVMKGKIVYEVEGKDYVTVPGGYMSLMEGITPHRMKDGFFSPCQALWINLNPVTPESVYQTPYSYEDLKRIINVFASTKATVTRASSLILNLFESYGEALYEWQKITPAPDSNLEEPAQCSHQLMAWIKILICAILYEAAHCYAKAEENTICSLVQKACRFMDEHYQDEIHVKDVVDYLDVSEVYLYKLFGKDLGQTPSVYLRNLRLEKACELLANTDESVTDIAIEVGFTSSQHLASVLRKQAGESPTAFRRRIKSQDEV